MKTRRKTSRLEEVFEDCKRRGEKALVTFVTAGDPDLATSRDIVFELESHGADIVELGIPFSDPMADGPTIQASSERALKEGATLAKVLRLVGEIRKKTDIPIVLFGYYNPIYAYGIKSFAKAAKRAGADGVLVVDLPPEESVPLKGALDAEGLDLIYLLTPTSDSERIRLISSLASGFIYYVSLTGVTGARKALSKEVENSVKRVKRHTRLPVAVGFGISSRKQAREVSRFADGIVVGSAIINIIAAGSGSKRRLRAALKNFVSTLKKGTIFKSKTRRA